MIVLPKINTQIKIAIIASQFLFSCVQNPNKAPEKPFFNLAEFVRSQTVLLATEDVSVNKHVTLDDKEETKIISPTDSSAWAEELGFLRELELSAAALSASYSKQVHKNGATSTCTYKLKPEDAARSNVQLLAFELSADKSLLNLRAEVKNAMELYNSTSSIYLTAAKKEGVNRINTYGLKANQAVVFNKTVNYTIKAEIIDN